MMEISPMVEASFDEAWAAASRIRGWLERNEAEALYSRACHLPADALIVEVGSYQGRATVLLAHSRRRILAVDPLLPGDYRANNMAIGGDEAECFRRNIAPYPNVSWFKGLSGECPKPEIAVSLLFVDADHTYPHPRDDFHRFQPWLSPEAIVAFHDYQMFEGVTRAVDELSSDGRIERLDQRGTLFVGKAKSGKLASVAPKETTLKAEETQPARTRVTGFSLFVLCHMFGRRGRAMARSLAFRQGQDVPLHLTAFYSRPEDARLLFEGAMDGPNPPKLTLVPIPAERIMCRAILFSEAEVPADLSHAVYMDADLWFPPDFWPTYAQAVAKEPAGYWSCTVLDIPCEASEIQVDKFTDISQEQLTKLSKGPRHNNWRGAVGHFQCIPRGLVQYPRDPIRAVNRADETFARAAIAASQDKRRERRVGSVCAFHMDHPHCWEGATQQL